MKKDDLLWGNVIKPIKRMPEISGGILIIKARVLYLGDRIQSSRKKRLEKELAKLLCEKELIYQRWWVWNKQYYLQEVKPLNRQIKAIKEEIELLPRVRVWKEEYYQIGKPSSKKEAVRMWNSFVRSQGLV